jgi:hypothetical protein
VIHALGLEHNTAVSDQFHVKADKSAEILFISVLSISAFISIVFPSFA